MGDSFTYRNATPSDLSSSSPLHNMISLSSSPPLSPQSPTLSRNHAKTTRKSAFFQSPVSSNNDPFAGNSKASLSSHPSFGKDQLRFKHVRGSPEKAAQAGLKTWVLPPAAAATSTVTQIRCDNRLVIDQTLEQHFFDSSDDNPSSSDWSSTAASSMQTTIPSFGLGIEDQQHSLGLGEAFQEPGSPSLGRKSRVRTFSRIQSSSSKDPFSGNGSSSFTNLEASPRIHRQSQRRRLTGSSPKKLSRSLQNSQFNNISSDESSSDEGLAPWEQMVSEKKSGVNWGNIVEQVFEKVDGSIELSKQNLTRIDPIVADLSKFVSLPPLRKEETSGDSFSRTCSFASAFERTTLSTSAFNSPKARSQAPSSSKIRMFLAGNRLQVFPSAFFELHNLVVLTIRDNGLEELPAAIGQLTNLKELNVAQNALRNLPAEIQKLRLDSFTYFPNLFDTPPAGAHLTVRRTFSHRSDQKEEQRQSLPSTFTSTSTSMGPPVLPVRQSRFTSRTSFAISGQQSLGFNDIAMEPTQLVRCLPSQHQISPRLPSLMEICMRVLLEPEEGDAEGKEILLESFESGCLVNLNQHLDVSLIKTLESARRSAVKAWRRVRPASVREATWCSGAEADETITMLSRRSKKAEVKVKGEDGEASNEESAEDEDRSTLFRINNLEDQLDRGDDSRRNPWFNRCPNPRHYASNVEDTPFDWPGSTSRGRIFSKPSVQRVEWVSHVAGVVVSQIRIEEVAEAQNGKNPISASKATLIPLQWKGCGPKCLDFLDDSSS